MKIIELDEIRKSNDFEATKKEFNEILKKATVGVRPPQLAINFYNFVARIPFKLGMIAFLLTSIDTVKVANRARKNQTDSAIQVIYDYRFRPRRFIYAPGDHLWLMSYNCRSVRSRGSFTRRAINFLLKKVSRVKSEMKVVSLGSGSASQMLQGISDNCLNETKIHLDLVDNNDEALKRGRENARFLGIEDLIDTNETTIGAFLEGAESNSIDIFEMVGLADYFKDEKILGYFKGIYKALGNKGFFLGANISSTEEADYAHRVACWPKMFYREPTEIVESLREAGFAKTNIWTEYCGLYTVWVAQKSW